MEKKYVDANIGGAVVIIEPTPDGKFDSKHEKMQKFGETVLEVGLNRSIRDINRNKENDKVM